MKFIWRCSKSIKRSLPCFFFQLKWKKNWKIQVKKNLFDPKSRIVHKQHQFNSFIFFLSVCSCADRVGKQIYNTKKKQKHESKKKAQQRRRYGILSEATKWTNQMLVPSNFKIPNVFNYLFNIKTFLLVFDSLALSSRLRRAVVVRSLF